MTSREEIVQRLDVARRELLDLTGRNRLLNTPRSRKRSSRLEIVDEKSAEVFRHLVVEQKSMTFLPAEPEPEAALGESVVESETVAAPFASDDSDFIAAESRLSQPQEDELPEDSGPDPRHVDSRLQTDLPDEKLQARLLRTYYDARTYEEEQGVNILFLALGFLKWYEADETQRERQAPLMLIPVKLDRRSANAKFRIIFSDDEIGTNLSLQEKLKVDFGIELPELSDGEDLNPDEYFEAVRLAVSGQSNWEVKPNDQVLWFFSFSKFLMYRDLQSERWPVDDSIETHSQIQRLLGDGYEQAAPLVDDESPIDSLLEPESTVHIMDADSSQALAIQEVGQGHDLVIQGPPGTGKSQTITNVIASAIHAGKRVLFMAEKMAALEVVKRRLDSVGLGETCLELHSHKSAKRAVLQQIGATLELGRPVKADVDGHITELKAERDRLNRHVESMNAVIGRSDVTPFEAIGNYVRLRSAPHDRVDIDLPEATRWSPAEVAERRRLLHELALHLDPVGVPREHAWRGVELDSILPSDLERLTGELPGRTRSLETLSRRSIEMKRLLPGAVECDDESLTLSDSAVLLRLARVLLSAPSMDEEAIDDSVWWESRRDIENLVESGETLRQCRDAIGDQVAEMAWSTDAGSARQAIAAHGGSWFRIFNADYRRGMATLRGILKTQPPSARDARVELLDKLIAGQKALKAIESDDQSRRFGSLAFGRLWRSTDSDWDKLAEILAWEQSCVDAELPDCFRKLVGRVENADRLQELVKDVDSGVEQADKQLAELFRSLRLDVAIAFAEDAVDRVPILVMSTRLETWRSHPELLRQWTDFQSRWRRLSEVGLQSPAALVFDGNIRSADLLDQFDLAWYEALIREAMEAASELAGFSGLSHEAARSRFRELDLQRIDLARRQVAAAHYERMPIRAGNVGEVGLLRREINKKRRHLPIRRLLSEAGQAVQAIKPVFMMSPASIAQFLEPGRIEFDLLVVDEASQVRPVDALGAFARVKQVVVVGDSKQLPPTHFFQRVTEDDSVDEDLSATRDLESILGLCEAQNVSRRMLRWHYRSRHHSLIAVSNREFYDNRLCVIPSPIGKSPELGLRFVSVEDGVFDRGGTATNRIEARRVADAVMKHARLHPRRSLGVGTFSVSQRDAILSELEGRRRHHPEFEEFFGSSGAEPFFVKNLENIQGDERDVIFISVGYARDEQGSLSMNFGPLSRDGGERRLNVLITRARRRCEVFSSIHGRDIDLKRAKAQGAASLKTFLEFAETGVLDVEAVSVESETEFADPFESRIAQAVRRSGFEVERRVGVAGFFVDLAVVDPKNADRHLLGIEVDGADYSSARWARDRDRLRHQILTLQGWKLHHIWSLDWFHRPDDQLEKTLAAIAAVQDADETASADSELAPSDGDFTDADPLIERHAEEGDGESKSPVESLPYIESGFRVPTGSELQDLAPDQLLASVEKVVDTEGPVHREELVRRLAMLWGVKRVGSKVSEVVNAAADFGIEKSTLEDDDSFLTRPGTEVTVRDRSEVASQNLRKPEMLPPSEMRLAVLQIVEAHFGVSHDEAVIGAARMLGFGVTTAGLRDRLEEQVQILIAEEHLEDRHGSLRVSA